MMPPTPGRFAGGVLVVAGLSLSGGSDAGGENTDAPGARDIAVGPGRGGSVRAVARQLGVAPSTVRETLRRFEASGVEWPLPVELTDGALEARLYGAAGTKRRALFEELDAPLLKPLPAEPYVLAQWRRARVGLDYHVEVEKDFYSVPYRHARAAVEVRLTARTVAARSGNDASPCQAPHCPSSPRQAAPPGDARRRRLS